MSKYSQSKAIDRTVRGLVREGWAYSVNGHARITAPSGHFLTFSVSPSDTNAHLQFERDVRRLKLTISKTMKEQKNGVSQ